ncbi:MAG: Crp/Fnr family transcriptional regulator [Ignavibacteria bacterium]|jgi:CRP-like cAMP-binding protein|nr:Crp/Fnr family transcriptional regulator [Ignavibacteria bacterium]MCU7517025.1 Crp/Fnr family transcriptional regulator [Ignavibacteria bacterium]
MIEIFRRYLQSEIPKITAEQIDLIESKCTLRKLRKKELLLKEGEVCDNKIFVLYGLLRNYRITGNGNEAILRFTDKCEWTTDPESYFKGLPSNYNIDAIEDSEVILIKHGQMEYLQQQISPFSEFMKGMMHHNAELIQKRVLISISGTADEKYSEFMQTYPGVFNRVPLHMIASYLGLSRETLTRVRQNLLKSRRV